MPIGACLYSRAVYSEQFDLRHGSTFGGNTLACRAAMATIEELTRDDQRLVRQVAVLGRRLQEQLRELQRDYPQLVADVRGRGLMLGVELSLDHVAESQSGVLAIMQQHGLLLSMAVSYLLNVGHVRIAASFTEGSVLRIEPPLVADAALCDDLVGALRNLLDVLQRGDAGALLAHLMPPGGSETLSRPVAPARKTPPPQSAVSPRKRATGEPKRFAFVVHLLGAGDLRQVDQTLESFSDGQLQGLMSRVAEFVKPFCLGELAIESIDGKLAEGEVIMLPHLPAELLALPGDEAVDLVQSAVELAAERGAEVVGLGGFSSIIADGGLALRAPAGVRVTSGNSMTTWAALQAIEAACAERNVAMADSTVAVVGASGAIGHALSLLCAERVAELILVGNPRGGAASLQRLRSVAEDCKQHVTRLAGAGRAFPSDTFAGRISRRSSPDPAGDEQAGVTITTDIDGQLPRAHIVLAATNAILPFISGHHLRECAIVCDISRPLNLMPGVGKERPDIALVSGGLVQVPDGAELGQLGDRDRPNVLMACAAETVILALSRYRSKHLCGRLDVTTVEEVGRLAESLGFSVSS
jgi:predicted amino acid dehydrogenase